MIQPCTYCSRYTVYESLEKWVQSVGNHLGFILSFYSPRTHVERRFPPQGEQEATHCEDSLFQAAHFIQATTDLSSGTTLSSKATGGKDIRKGNSRTPTTLRMEVLTFVAEVLTMRGIQPDLCTRFWVNSDFKVVRADLVVEGQVVRSAFNENCSMIQEKLHRCGRKYWLSHRYAGYEAVPLNYDVDLSISPLARFAREVALVVRRDD